MWKVLFGQQDDFARIIVDRLDRRRYKAEFANVADADLSRYDCILPFVMKDYEVLDQHRDLEGVKFWHPEKSIVRLCHDKLAFNEYLLRGASGDLIPPMIKGRSTHFPYILKKRFDGNGKNSHLVMNPQDEAACQDLIGSRLYFRQTYIPGPIEYAIHVLIVDKKIRYSQIVQYEMGSDYYVKGRQRQPVTAALLPDAGPLEVFTPLLRSLGYNGTCCINYKIQDGQPKLMELNPRFGFSLCLDINRYLEAYRGTLARRSAVGSLRQRMVRSIGIRFTGLENRR